ncbi:YARHG domain-containing protein [Lacrimispora celerecrescens]|uniref:YARHG domain-containing protein n=1 Tax=[Clostridium] celerecrescens 18A TaxID=1286362 RepID=A0A2M8Z4S8_9FIRM|nr:YARHG domain-containing protein [Lacrimispora celerecrescens]PJJ28435.1 YARHG domain-containing protein [[Clostridium] celerecrescens 18A]
MNKKGVVKLSNMRYLYYGLGILIGCFVLWISLIEGKRLHYLDMEIMPAKQSFVINVGANGEGVDIFAAEKGVHVSVSYTGRLEEQQTRLIIEGSIRGKTSDSTPIHLFMFSLDNTDNWQWELLSSVGLSSIHYSQGEMANIRGYLYLFAVIIFGVLGVFQLLKNNRKKRSYAKERLLEFKDDPVNQAAFEAGKRWFLIHDRRRYWNRCLILLFACGSGFYIFQEYLYEWVFLNSLDYIGTVFILSLVILSLGVTLRVYWAKKHMEVLTKENRPLTAAAAFLMEAAYGSYRYPSYYKKQIHNAAVGFARAGRFEQALKLADNDWKGVHEKKLMQLVHSNLCFVCYIGLGWQGDAEAEYLYQKQLVNNYPKLKRIGEAMLLLSEIRKAYMDQKFGQVEAYVNVYCDRFPDAYHRIPLMPIQMNVYKQAGEMDKAKNICGNLLSYSPENKAVREAMGYGACTYAESPGFLKDKAGLVCRIVLTGVLGIYTVLFGILMLMGSHHWGSNKTIVYEETKAEEFLPQTNATEKAEAESMETEMSETEQEPAFPASDSQAPGFELDLPKEWNRLAVRNEFKGGCSYHQKKSFDLMGDGVLFYIQAYPDCSYVNLPDYEIWGYDGPYVYVMSLPTDVTFYMDDNAIMEEYNKMHGEISQIRDTFRIQSDTAKYDGSEFVFPNSSDSLLQEPDLWNLSASQLRIARNEIYARHGRRFADEELQRYFNQCSWYEGTIDPNDFKEDVLNETERFNVRLIHEQQKRME